MRNIIGSAVSQWEMPIHITAGVKRIGSESGGQAVSAQTVPVTGCLPGSGRLTPTAR